MFSVVRLIICFVFLVSSIALIKASKLIRKRVLYVVSTSISVVLFIVLVFLPLENMFITFDSPEEAYEYYILGESNIELVVEGRDCDLVIDRNNESDTYLIIPKTKYGWKIGIGSDTKRIAGSLSNGISVSVYQYKDTNDYFITIFDINGGEANVSDSCNTEFYSLEKSNSSLEKTFVTYYAHIYEFNSQYSLEVNGSKIVFGS